MPQGPNSWWVRRDGRVRGPFVTGLVRRHVLLGRIRPDDEVSHDRETWVRVAEVPELVPEELRDPGPEAERLLRARLRADERSGLDRRGDGAAGGRRAGRDRRAPEPEVLAAARRERTRTLEARRAARPRYRVQAALTGALVALVLVGLARLAPRPAAPAADCGAPPTPGVDWTGCLLEGVSLAGAELAGARLREARLAGARFAGADLRGADLAFADLTGADLRGARLAGARLTGARLRGARLEAADLRGARLDYADLLGAELGGADLGEAVLDEAVWTDGTRCRRGSRGACATGP